MNTEREREMDSHVNTTGRSWRGFAFGIPAAVLVLATLWLPLWTMTLEAPQYPSGLYLRAYGDRVEGDLREINIINHYVGMAPIDAVPAPEMKLFPLAVWSLVVLCLVGPLHRRVQQLAVVGTVLLPVVTLADLQWWLYRFGNDLDPKAPLRFIEPFTPLAIGISKIGNFRSTAMLSYGMWAMVLAALLLYAGLKHVRMPAGAKSKRRMPALAAPLAALPLLLPGAAHGGPGKPQGVARAAAIDLQGRLAAAPAGATLQLDPGVYAGPITVRGPMTLEGRGDVVIEGDGVGSVVVVEGDGVVLRGLTIRRSGRATSAEAAGIKATGSGHRFEGNWIEDVYFGIHLANGTGNVVRDNDVRPGERGGVRPGHAISLWYQQGASIVDNRVQESRDGVYLSFADDVLVERNQVEGARYGVHSMYSKRSSIRGNVLRGNLVGAALMYSDGLTMRCNRIERHREGATAYGVLLKDIDDLVLESNELLGNRVGIYADNTPLGADRLALVRDNLIAGNDTALALQTTVRLTFSGNRIIGNLMTARSEGGRLSTGNRWSLDGRGNFWDEYQGFDHDGDGIGDLPYRYETLMNEMIRRQPLMRALLYTPAHDAIEQAARMFPVFRPAPLIVDDSPLMNPDGGQILSREQAGRGSGGTAGPCRESDR